MMDGEKAAYGTLPSSPGNEDIPVHEQVAPVKTTAKDAKKNYDSLAWIYDSWSCWERPFLRAGIASLDPQLGERCLEIGCGTGSLLPALAERVASTGSVVAVDISPKMLKRAEKRVAQTRRSNHNLAPVHFICADMGDSVGLGGTAHGAAGTYDAVIATFVLELFPVDVTRRVLAEVRRLLKPTGRLCVVAMSAVNPKGVREPFNPPTAKKTCATRFYEKCHKWFPRTVDCRPIYAAATLAAAGFAVEPVLDKVTQASVAKARKEYDQRPYGTQLLPMYGLNVEVICCQQSDAGLDDVGGGDGGARPRRSTMGVAAWVDTPAAAAIVDGALSIRNNDD